MDDQERYIILVAEPNYIPYTLVNFSAPIKHPTKFFSKILKLAKRMQRGGLVFCGEFNMVMNRSVDSTSTAVQQQGIGPLCCEEGLPSLERTFMVPGAVCTPQKRILPFILLCTKVILE